MVKLADFGMAKHVCTPHSIECKTMSSSLYHLIQIVYCFFLEKCTNSSVFDDPLGCSLSCNLFNVRTLFGQELDF